MMSETESETEFQPVDADSAPDNFQIATAYELEPERPGTPPATAKLFMSPEFTNEGGADADFGKTRHYVVVIEYPPILENTVVRMNDCSTALGSRIFRKFVENTAAEKHYQMDRVDITELIQD